MVPKNTIAYEPVPIKVERVILRSLAAIYFYYPITPSFEKQF